MLDLEQVLVYFSVQMRRKGLGTNCKVIGRPKGLGSDSCLGVVESPKGLSSDVKS